ncbi:MAG: PQQ-dependent sugar dehydrogenase, partial [Gammaproteobacteria bacterium]
RVASSFVLPALSVAAVLLAGGCGGGTSGSSSEPSTPPAADTAPPLEVIRLFPGLTFANPVSLAQAPGDGSRWFVVEKRGVVRVFANDPGVASSEVFIDISDQVDQSFGESGLLGMAFHPAFPSTPEVYVSYTAPGAPLVSRVARFRLDSTGTALDPSTEEVLLEIDQPRTNHNGGDLAFGPSGFLYASFGDGGGSGDPDENAQDTGNLLGSIIRIDVDTRSGYEIPAGNPFASGSLCGNRLFTGSCAEIFAWGFRNPWRMSFDPATGRLWLGDVGQNAWEEIDRVELGGNYGWNVREGAHCFDPPTDCGTSFLEPVTEYDRAAGQSVTGGHVYRGGAVPGLVGWYVFGDFVSGALFAVREDSQPTAPAQPVGNTGLNISTFAVDTNGELLVVDYASGSIHQVVAAPDP